LPLSRRNFLKGLGVTAVGLTMSAADYDHLNSPISQPDDLIPGVSAWYATSCRECPAGCGMIVRNNDSHVTKCEGNPGHPINQGRLCARGQAALQGLYDPDRVKGPMRRVSGKLNRVKWDTALGTIGSELRSKRIAMISDLQTGSLDALMRTWLKALGSDRFIIYEPVDYEAVKAVSGGVVPSFDISKSDYLVSFGADFLETWISPVEFAGQFAEMRAVKSGVRARFVYVGPRVSMTAANADQRFIAWPGPTEIEAIRKDLAGAKSPLILPGNYPKAARAAAMLAISGNVSRPHALTNISARSEVESLVRDMEAGQVDALIVYGANPVYGLGERFIHALERVPIVISLSSFLDETASHAGWILPSNIPLESWGDYQPYPDVTNLMQPVMGNLFDTRQTGDILIGLARAAGIDAFKARRFLDYLRLRWGLSSTDWEKLLQAGWSSRGPSSAIKPQKTSLGPSESEKGLRLFAFPHPYLYDGRGANKRWLQELPEPVTQGVWGTWAELHPDTAKELGVKTDDLIRINAKVEVPAYVWGGVAPGTIAVPMGEGHTAYGRFAKGVGANVLGLNQPVSIEVIGEQWFARIKGYEGQHGRDIVQTVDLGKPIERGEITMPLPSGYTKHDFYPGHEHSGGHRWAMVVDLDKCIGCHACEAACYAENNIGTVGKDGIWRRREMAWIRIDPYMDWKDSAAPILFQPMLCQHCDSAPCEAVCPVYAAAHNNEGLNMQIYNRCVGTRYCSNNCPYKVRRFNWFDYRWPPPLQYQLNPNVTVRRRGVMEKCTFCIQRIREAELTAIREYRGLREGEITPACAQTCPTGVFTFGDLMDSNSQVSRIIRTDPRAYQVLRELNTKPAVIYLKRIVERVE